MDILSLFACFETLMTATSGRQLGIIAHAMLTLTGRMTMLSLSRWTEKGGSYRTLQRFFATRLPWSKMLVKFFETHLFNPFHEFILAIDATTVTKAGDLTHGIGRFFSGVLGQVVKGLEFMVIALVDVTRKKAYPLLVKQTLRSEAEKEASKQRKKKKKKRAKKAQTPPRKPRGRPQGSLNKDKMELNLSAELLRINEMLKSLLKLLRIFVQVKYLTMDGHFGHNQAVLMAQSNGLHLISKLRRDAKLLEKYEGNIKNKKYGERINCEAMPRKYLVKTEIEGEIIVNYYQGVFLHQEFGMELNVVVIVKTDLKKEKVGAVILFSDDLELGWEKLIEYYSLRFQIEFNFRDAKQHFGLEDFMNTTEIGVENAANLAFLMVNVSAKMLTNKGENCIGINDLKSQSRGLKYAVETIKIVLEKAEGILMAEAIEQVKEKISKIGSIHHRKSAISTA